MTKFKIGDQVKVVNYGSMGFMPDGPRDFAPERIGKIGIIVKAEQTQGIDTYAFEDSAWYDNGQLELIYRPEYK